MSKDLIKTSLVILLVSILIILFVNNDNNISPINIDSNYYSTSTASHPQRFPIVKLIKPEEIYPVPPISIDIGKFSGKIEITPSYELDVSGWKKYTDKKADFNIIYPKEWELSTSSINSFSQTGKEFENRYITLKKKDHIIEFWLVDDKDIDLSGGGRVIQNPLDFVTYQTKDFIISRAKNVEISEIGHTPYLPVCHIETGESNLISSQFIQCSSTIKNKNAWLGLSYRTKKDTEFNESIVKEMDSILQNIRFE